MTPRSKKWADVYSIERHPVTITPTDDMLSTGSELSAHINKLWAPKDEDGWKNSYVPLLIRADFFADGVKMVAGTARFSQANGNADAIVNNLPFSPNQGYTNCLSVGAIPVTSDEYILLQKRSDVITCPGSWIHPCGYMTSLTFDPKNCDNPEHANDSRLFDVSYQTVERAVTKEFKGITESDFIMDRNPDFMGVGFQSIEFYFSNTARLNVSSKDIKNYIGDQAIPGTDIKEHTTHALVPLDKLESLILNQARLAGVDHSTYESTAIDDLPIIDETLTGILFGNPDLLGINLDREKIIHKLNSSGYDLMVKDTSPGISYEFPKKL